jgi:cytochrome c2
MRVVSVGRIDVRHLGIARLLPAAGLMGTAARSAITASALAVLLAATGVAHADGDVARGEKRFDECVTCHSLKEGVNGVGPSLHAVFGRKAGGLDDFRYSPAMKRSGLTWTPQALATFIADPQKAVPNNRMPFAGVPEAADRDDLIAYLEKAAK